MRQNAINLVFAILIVIVGVYFVFGEIFLPSDQLDQETFCVKYTGKWERIAEEGARKPVTMPGKCKAERDETVIVETILPDKIGNDCYLCFRSAKQDMRFYDVRI